jgi:hypothetical protein
MVLVYYGFGEDAKQYFEKYFIAPKKKTRSKKVAVT